MPASPVLDFHVGPNANATATLSSNFTSHSANVVVFLFIMTLNAGGSGTIPISSVTSNSGLVFFKARPIGGTYMVEQAQCISGSITNRDLRGECWATYIPIAGTYNFKITAAAVCDTLSVNILGFAGAQIPNSLDSNLALGLAASNPGSASSPTPIAIHYSTSQADDLLIFFSASLFNAIYNTPSGWTLASGPWFTNNLVFTGYTKSLSAPVTNASVTEQLSISAGKYTGLVGYVIAITADAGGNPVHGCGPTIPLPS